MLHQCIHLLYNRQAGRPRCCLISLDRATLFMFVSFSVVRNVFCCFSRIFCVCGCVCVCVQIDVRYVRFALLPFGQCGRRCHRCFSMRKKSRQRYLHEKRMENSMAKIFCVRQRPSHDCLSERAQMQ